MKYPLRRTCWALALAGTLLSANSFAQQRRRTRAPSNPAAAANPVPGSQPPASPAPGPNGPEIPARGISRGILTNIQISYKLDPRITDSLDTGERWVTPATYAAAQNGKAITVEARVHGLDAEGNAVGIGAQWMPEDPGIATVWPGQANNEVKITVQRAGESRVRLIAGGISRELDIKASCQADIIRVEFTQKQ